MKAEGSAPTSALAFCLLPFPHVLGRCIRSPARRCFCSARSARRFKRAGRDRRHCASSRRTVGPQDASCTTDRHTRRRRLLHGRTGVRVGVRRLRPPAVAVGRDRPGPVGEDPGVQARGPHEGPRGGQAIRRGPGKRRPGGTLLRDQGAGAHDGAAVRLPLLRRRGARRPAVDRWKQWLAAGEKAPRRP